MFIILDRDKNILEVSENGEVVGDEIRLEKTTYVGQYSLEDIGDKVIPSDIFVGKVYKYVDGEFVENYTITNETPEETELKNLRNDVSTMKVALDELIFGGMI